MTLDSPDAAVPVRRKLRVAMLAAVVPYLLLVWRFDFVCDDAYISFRYARHLAAGAGLRFNPGEHPPVEGYSNLLWVLLMTPFEALGWDVTLAARALGTAAGLALIALVARFAAGVLELGTAATALTALFVATLPPLAAWSTGGLETALFALLLFGVLERLLDAGGPRTGQAAACAALAELTRTDGTIWVGIVLAAVGAVALLATSDRARRAALLRSATLVLVAVLATLAAHTGLRLVVHGDWVSNTARAKGVLQPARGLDYVASFFLAVPSAALAVLLGATALGVRAARGALVAAGVTLALGLAYVVLPGGDFMTFGRLLVPLAPALGLLVGCGLRAAAHPGASRVSTAIAWALAVGAVSLSVAAAFDMHVVPRAARERFAFRGNAGAYRTEVEQWRDMKERARLWELQGRALALYTRPGESMIAYAIGALGYPNEVFLLDAFGLVDRDVARVPPDQGLSTGHARAVTPEFFYPRKPTYYGCAVVPIGAPEGAGLGIASFKDTALSRQVRIERHPLPPGRGFPEGTEQRLYRFTLW